MGVLDAECGAPHPDPSTSPCHCSLGTQRDVTRKNEVRSHLLINIALPLLSEH